MPRPPVDPRATKIPRERHELGEQQLAFRYSDGERELIFLCNDATAAATVAFSGRTYELPAQSVSLIARGELLLNTAEILPQEIIEHTFAPVADTITAVAWYAEPFPSSWPAALQSAVTAENPIEQLLLTHDTTDYCWYTVSFIVPADQAGEGVLTLVGVADVVHIFVDGKFRATTATPLLEDRGSLAGEHFTQSFTLNVAPGTHELAILCTSIGLIKGDWMISANMAEERKGLWGQALWNGVKIAGPWTVQPGLFGEQAALYAAGGALVQWYAGLQGATGEPLRWWKIAFSRPHGDAPVALDLTGMNKGIAWLNGRCIGRYWLVSGTPLSDLGWQEGIIYQEHEGGPSQRYYHLPAEWLREQNELVLFEEIGGDPSTVSVCTIQ